MARGGRSRPLRPFVHKALPPDLGPLYYFRDAAAPSATWPGGTQSTGPEPFRVVLDSPAMHSLDLTPGSADVNVSGFASVSSVIGSDDEFPRRFAIALGGDVPAATWRFSLGVDVSGSLSGTVNMSVVVYVWRPSASSVVGIVMDGSIVQSYVTTGTNSVTLQGALAGAAVSGVTAGDYLVIETWGHAQSNSGSGSRTLGWHYDAPSGLGLSSVQVPGLVLAAGGTTFPVTATDTGASVSDGGISVNVTRTITDTGAAVSDVGISPVRLRSRTITDTGASVAGDAVAATRIRAITLTDTGASVSDAGIVATKAFGRSLTDTGASVSDAGIVPLLLRVRTLTDTGAAVSETLARNVTRTLLDTGATVSDALAPSRNRVVAISDTGATVTESLALSRLRSKTLTDTGASISSDAVAATRVRTIALTDAGASVSESVAAARTRVIALSDSGTGGAGGSFPQNGVLDDFNRAGTSSPPSTNWTNNPYGDGNALALNNDSATVKASSSFGSAYWNVATFQDSEVYAKISALPSAGSTNEVMALGWRTTGLGVGANIRGYQIEVDNGQIKVGRLDNSSTFVQLGATIAYTAAVGDVVGATMIGSTITVYVNGVAQGTRTDSTYAGPGALTMELQFPATADSFGGGAASSTGSGVTDTLARTPGFIRSVSDTGAAVSDAGMTRAVKRVLTDTGAVVSETLAPNVRRFLTDTGATISDALAFFSTRVRTLADTGASVSEALARTAAFFRSFTDTGATISEALAGGRSFFRSFSDTGASVSDVGLVRRVTRVISDVGAVVTDAFVRGAIRVIVDTGASISDAVSMKAGRFVSDTGATVSDALVVARVRVVALTDTGASISDSFARAVGRTLTDTGATITESLAKTGATLSRSISDVGASISESLSRRVGRTITDTGAAISDSAVRVASFFRTFSDTGASVSDSISGGRSFTRSLTDTGAVVSETLAIVRKRVVALTDAGAVISETLVKLVSRTLLDTGASVSESIVRTRTVPRTVTDTGAAITESFVRAVARVLSDVGASVSESVASVGIRPRTLTDTGASVTDGGIVRLRQVFRTLLDTGASIVDALTHRPSYTLTDSGASISDSISVGSPPRFITDTGASVSDSVARQRAVVRTVTDSITISDTVTRAFRSFRTLSDQGASVADHVGRAVQIRLLDQGATVSEALAARRYFHALLTDQGAAFTGDSVFRYLTTPLVEPLTIDRIRERHLAELAPSAGARTVSVVQRRNRIELAPTAREVKLN